MHARVHTHTHQRSRLGQEAWTVEEDLQLIEAHKTLGNRWAEIAKVGV